MLIYQREKYERFSPNQEVLIQTSRRSSSLFAFVLVVILVIIFLFPVFYLQHFFKAFLYKHDLFWRNKEQSVWDLKSNNFVSNIAQMLHESKELPLPPKPDYAQCKLLNDLEKFDCLPEDGANANACEARGCCWVELKTEKEQKTSLNVPYCFYPPNYQSYSFLNVTETAYGLNAFLRRKYRSPYPNDVEIIKMDVRYDTSTRLHVKVNA